jgi:hypothetical protein
MGWCAAKPKARRRRRPAPGVNAAAAGGAGEHLTRRGARAAQHADCLAHSPPLRSRARGVVRTACAMPPVVNPRILFVRLSLARTARAASRSFLTPAPASRPGP